MSEIFELNLLLNPECSNSSDNSWEFSQSGGEGSLTDIISTLQTSTTPDYTDLEDFLDIGDPSDVVTSNSSFGSNVEVLDLYSEANEISQLQFENQIQFEKEKLAKENEEGLLEALQRSMDMECNSVSEFVSLTSTLDQPPSLTTTSGFPTSITPHCVSMSTFENQNLEFSVENAEDESMLKRLLLSPTYDNYPKEIDANNNTMQLDSMAVEVPTSEREEKSNRQNKQYESGRIKKQKPIAKKPFTELLKHLESSSTDKNKDLNKNKTRVLNMTRYLRQYGSAPPSRVASPFDGATEKQTKTGRGETKKRTKGKSNQSKTAGKINRALENGKPECSNKVVTAADMESLLEMIKKKPITSTTEQPQCSDMDLKTARSNDRRRGAVLIDPLPKKRQKVAADAKKENIMESTTECTEKPSADHDYCQKNEDSQSSDSDILSAALKASGLPKKKKKREISDEEKNKEAKAANKVLKWEEYLQRVRLGIRSAPNSPTCSPKIKRGSARPINNFMVALATKNSSINLAASNSQPTVTKLTPPIVEAQMPKRKQSIKLQEFKDYLANLQANQDRKESDTDNNPQPMSVTVTPIQDPNPASHEVMQKPKKPPKTPASRSKRTSKSRSRPVIIPTQTSQTFLKINSGGTIHTVAVTSARTVPQNNPMMMIRIPQLQQNKAASSNVLTLTTTNSSPQPCVIKPATTNHPAQIIQCRPAQIIVPPTNTPKSVDPRANLKIPKKQVNLKPIPRENWSKASKSKPTVTSPTTSTPPTSTAPTFKLITANKAGAGAKSVILSGVTGQLKEILTVLSQQQQQQQKDGNLSDPSSCVSTQQQKTLQQLLAAIAELKSKKSSPNTVNPTTSTVTTSVTGPTNAGATAVKVSANPQELKATRRQHHVPSPLSLIHEIKQNLNKKSESSKKVSQPKYVYTVPAKSTQQISAQESNCIITAGGAVLKTCSSAESLKSSKPVSVTKSNSLEDDQITVFVDGSDSDFNQKDSSQNANSIAEIVKTKETVPSQKAEQKTASCMLQEAVKESSKVVLMAANTEDNNNQDGMIAEQESVMSTQARNPDHTTYVVTSGVTDSMSIKCDTVTSIPDTLAKKCDNPCSQNATEYKQTDADNGATSILCTSNLAVTELPLKTTTITKHVPICRSIAAAEMMASEIMDEGQQEVAVYDEVTDTTSSVNEITQNMLWDESLQVSDVEENIDENVDVDFYNKLPAYLYNRKVNCTEPESSSNLLIDYSLNDSKSSSLLGLKELSCDPLISTEGNTPEIHYNKLPHYFSSGKLAPSETSSDGIRSGSSGQKVRGLHYSTKMKCTPEGAVLNMDDTYYSRLPNYYNYGRPHVVGTVTEPPELEDETVTSQSLLKADVERRERRAYRKRKSEMSKKKFPTDNRMDGDRILYSKIPQYYLSGRKSLVPQRRTSEHSFSSASSDEEEEFREEERGRSFRKSYSRSPSRNRSYSRSSSRSPSPRSWRNERNCYVDHERDYSSSGSEYDSYSRPAKRRRRHSGSDSEEWGGRRRREEKKRKELHNKAIQDRRVMYVGRIDLTTTRNDLRKRFQKFGEIEDVTLYFRQDRDSYGFVTFRYTCDTFTAIEQGNNGDVEPKYDLCFGGRRQFCQVDYADLDEGNEDAATSHNKDEDDFDSLLRKAMRR
nr:uncharacterized protein LOC100184997 isoform X2 [Ciona intestinalis]|eukprot:XP_018667584.1 uncharacterized protein LOC100184997 isoform X2 [Ciona intestinalis]